MSTFQDFINALDLAQRYNLPVALQMILDPTTGQVGPWSGTVSLSSAPGAAGVTINHAGSPSLPNAPIVPMDVEWVRVRQLADATAMYTGPGPTLGYARGPRLGMRG